MLGPEICFEMLEQKPLLAKETALCLPHVVSKYDN
jgi:hypothetical protein